MSDTQLKISRPKINRKYDFNMKINWNQQKSGFCLDDFRRGSPHHRLESFKGIEKHLFIVSSKGGHSQKVSCAKYDRTLAPITSLWDTDLGLSAHEWECLLFQTHSLWGFMVSALSDLDTGMWTYFLLSHQYLRNLLIGLLAFTSISRLRSKIYFLNC